MLRPADIHVDRHPFLFELLANKRILILRIDIAQIVPR